VEIAFAGEVESVEEMYERLKIGPGAAHIRELEELDPPGQFPRDFRIGF